jgi:glycosyltransferase involved in cell wall biosynthesis
MPYDLAVKTSFKQSQNVFFVISNASVSPQLLEIVKSLKNNLVEVDIFIIADEGNLLLSSLKKLHLPLRVLATTSKYGLLRYSFFILIHLINSRPKTVLTSGQYASLIGIPVAYILRIRNRIHIRHHSNFHHKYKMRFALALDQILNFCSTKIVAVSQLVKNILVEKERVPEGKVEIIYNGVDLNRFYPSSKTPSNKDDLFRIGVVARLTEWKGVEYTALAFKAFVSRYPDSHLQIIGANSDSFSNVSTILKDVPKDKYFMEFQNFNIPKFLHSINVLVHVPLEIDDEAFGIIYVETLASGTPAIFTISGILNEIDNPEKYFSVVPSRDHNAILNELEKLYNGTIAHEKIPTVWLEQFSLHNQGLLYLRLISS